MSKERSRRKGWSRRDFLKVSAAAGATLLTPAGCADPPTGRQADSRTPRNVILLTGDDLGWNDLSSSGNPNVKTPNLDRLRRGGASFSRAFDVTSTCSSSRTTYATGQYPHTHGVVGLVHRLPELSLREGTPTLASHMREAGLLTAIVGKFHLAHPQTPEPYGYDEVMTTLLTQRILDSDASVDFVERMAGRRFYFEINYMNPHRNYFGGFDVHPDHPHDPAAIVIPAYARLPDVPRAREELAAYYSQVERMDVMVGELVAALEREGLLDETLITFISDNGMPFPGNKLNLYDRGTGTPWFFHWPAGLPAGLDRNDLVSSVDLMPTLLEAVGVAIPQGVQGQSVWPLVRDRAATQERTAVFSEMTQHLPTPFPMRSARVDHFRYIRNYSDEPVPLEGAEQPWVMDVVAQRRAEFPWGVRRVPEELYDLAQDPQEQVNLAQSPQHADMLAALRARLDAHMTATADPFLGRPFERI